MTYDYRAGRKTAIKPWLMDGFRETWREQVEAAERAEGRIREVEGWLREIERGTWDREGAVEDMGGKK